MKRNRRLHKVLTPGEPLNLSRRRFLLASAGIAAGALVLGVGLPVTSARAAGASHAVVPGTRVPAFLEIHPDGRIRFLSPFAEGGQGIFTAMAQLVGEELDADPAVFLVENAPAGADYLVMPGGQRSTGGSLSVRSSYHTMRRLGALARQMLLQAAARQMGVPIATLTTEPGRVIHADSGRELSYGQLAALAMDLPVPSPDSVTLKSPAKFRWIGQPVKRLDVHQKSTGQARYSIDYRVDNMLQAAIQHAPRLGMTPGTLRNEQQVSQMKGVHSVHRLDGAVAVVAERWWHAKRAVEALQVDWQDPGPDGKTRYMPADFCSGAYAERLANTQGMGVDAEVKGDVGGALDRARTTLSATYHSQYLNHAQLEPPSATARFNPDGSLELWMPNQEPELFQADAAARTGIAAEKIIIHSPLMGGFFGRHFRYDAHALVYPQAIELAKATGRPVKVIWSREEEFLRDTHRPMTAVRLQAGLDDEGMPIALEAITVGEGAGEAQDGHQKDKVDGFAVEGLAGKSYAIANRRIAQIYDKGPATIGYWRSVGHSMNDFIYESFLDEIADKGGHDPFELRLKLLRDNPRLTRLLREVALLSGGWKAGPFIGADGSRRARGIAMASPFGSQAAAIAEVSIENGEVRVHDVWQVIDPGKIVNPAIIEAQVNSAVALGLSQVLLEECIYRNGVPVARNYDLYPILPPTRMARVHVRIVESGENIGGVGEPPLPAVPAAVANAVSRLTGQRIRRMPLSRYTFS